MAAATASAAAIAMRLWAARRASSGVFLSAVVQAAAEEEAATDDACSRKSGRNCQERHSPANNIGRRHDAKVGEKMLPQQAPLVRPHPRVPKVPEANTPSNRAYSLKR